VTILYTIVRHDRALIAMDTMQWDDSLRPVCAAGGALAEMCKFEPLPLARAVVAMRGSCFLGDYLRPRLRQATSTDALVDDVMYALEDARVHFGRNPDVYGCEVQGWEREEVHVIGWSEQHECMTIASATAPERLKFKQEVRHVQPSTWRALMSPPPASDEDMPRDAHALAAMVRAALARARAADPTLPCGGNLLIAEVNRHRIELSHHGDLDVSGNPEGKP
jgi:hypothetical protein